MNNVDNSQSTNGNPLRSFAFAKRSQAIGLYTIMRTIEQSKRGARSSMAIDEERLQENLSHPVVLETWGITKTERYAKIFGALHLVALVAMTVTLIAYFVTSPADMIQNRTSGLVIVVVLIYAISVVRFTQISAEKKDIPDFKAALARELTGQDEHDVAAQDALESSYHWPSRHYMIITRMAFITAFVVLMINTYQLGRLDFMRTVVFDLSILTYLLGSLWNNYTFKNLLLRAELEERLRAAMEYRDAHPEEFEEDNEADGFCAEIKDDAAGYQDNTEQNPLEANDLRGERKEESSPDVKNEQD